MIIVESKNKIPIRLTVERWTHIVNRHPEMEGQKERVLEAITNPEVMQEGDFGELLAVKYYKSTPLTSKFLVAVYKEVNDSDGFVVTAYFTNRLSERRKTLWKR